MTREDVHIKAAEIKDRMSVGTGQEIYRLVMGMDKGHITVEEAGRALAWMDEHGKPGSIAWAEIALEKTGTSRETVMARQPDSAGTWKRGGGVA